jgi:hypothetical protein
VTRRIRMTFPRAGIRNAGIAARNMSNANIEPDHPRQGVTP